MIKKRFGIIILICVMMNTIAFAKSGLLTGEKDIRVVKTQWFDIIYPARCELSAAILYKNVDAVYEEIAELYGRAINYRLPVVVTPAIEIDNAYYNSYPYNHIVIYDTAIIDDLNVFSETLISTFKHELVHAYTYNMKNNFWKILGFFSDSLSFAAITVAPGMAEGATVSTESANGEGRMNDEYSLHTIKQSIIEDEFPGYAEIRGSRDVYPFSGYYYFSGAFHKWLQEKYGMEKYAQYWYNCVNNSISNNGAFSKAYKMTYQKAWKKFEKEFSVPEVSANPVEAGEVKDFFMSEKNKYSKNNNSGSRYTNLFMAENGLFYRDSSCLSIYFVEKSQLKAKTISPVRILKNTSIYDFNVSPDGKYFIITYDDENTATSTLRNVLYSFDGKNVKKLYEFKETGFYNCSILQKNEKYYLFANQYNSSHYSMIAKELEIDGVAGEKQAELGHNLFEKVLPVYKYASEYIQCGNDKFAFVKKDGMDFSICICDFGGNILQELASPEEKMTIKNLSFNQAKNEIIFSWVKKGTMPRIGVLNLTENTFDLCTSDISGGIFEPYFYDDDLIYLGKFYKENRIFVKKNFETDWKFEKFDATDVEFNQFLKISDSDEVANDILDSAKLSDVSKTYNQFNYYGKGIFIPFPVVNIKSKTVDGFAENLYLGGEWITSNPWDSDLLQLDFGTNFDISAFKVAFSSGTDTAAFKYSIASQSEFDKTGWRFSDITGTVNVSKSFDKLHGSIYLGTNESYGHYSNYVTNINQKSQADYFYSYNEAGISFSNILKDTSGKYGWKGLGIEGRLYNEFSLRDDGEEILDNYDVMLHAVGYIPQLLPWKDRVGFVTNLPLKIEVSLFPPESKNPELLDRNKDDFVNNIIPSYALQLDTEMILYAKDLQRSFDKFPILYFNEIRISLCTKGGFEMPAELENQTMKILTLSDYPKYIIEGSSKFSTLINLKTVLGLGFNFGNLCRTGNDYLCFELGVLPINRNRPVRYIHLYFDAQF